MKSGKTGLGGKRVSTAAGDVTANMMQCRGLDLVRDRLSATYVEFSNRL